MILIALLASVWLRLWKIKCAQGVSTKHFQGGTKMNIKIKLVGLAVALIMTSAAASAQDVIGYITKSATNAGWMMINQGAADAAAEEGVKLVAVGPSFQGAPLHSHRPFRG